jgi:hypothetical protein
MDQDLIDRIYECAFAPDTWPRVLDEISGIAGARGGSLLTANDSVLNWTASESLAEVWDALQARGLMACGDRFRRLVGVSHSGFLTELDGYVSEAEMGEDPLYRDVLWPRGLGWAAATAIPLPTGDTMVLTFERNRASGPAEPHIIDQLDACVPIWRGARCCPRDCRWSAPARPARPWPPLEFLPWSWTRPAGCWPPILSSRG